MVRFDLFHVGHLRLLQAAKKMCDALVVGVSTDELVKSYKNHPAIPFEQRMEIIKGLSCADAVVAQYSLDKYEAWRRIGFDKLFIGDDWFDTPSWREYESKMDIPIIYLPYTSGVSSTKVKEHIREL